MSNVIPFPIAPRQDPTPEQKSQKSQKSRMKNGLRKRGKYYHYKKWDPVNGKNVWQTTKQTTFESAELWVQANIINPEQERLLEEVLGLKPIKKATFKSFVEEEYWPYAEEKNKESTIKANQYKMRLLERFFDERGIEQLTDIPDDIEIDYKKWRKRMVKRVGEGTPKGATINRELKLLSKICKLAVKRGYLREDPTKIIEYYAEKPPIGKAISQKEFQERFLKHCNPRNKYATTEFFEFAFRTGARFSEITGLKWNEHIDLKGGHILLLDRKNGEDTPFPMTDYLRSLLVGLYETRTSEYVFPGSDGRRRKDVSTAFKNTLKRAGLPQMRFHDLRGSFISNCAQMGMTWEQISEFTGHSSYDTYRRYRHLFLKEQKKLLERWDENV